MSEPLHTGGCMCGAVRFEVREPLLEATWCHCTRCQRRTGTSGSAQARVATGSVVITEGADHVRGYAFETGMEKMFCPTCGAHLFSRDPRSGELWSIRLGAFDADPGVRPQWRAHVTSACEWDPLPDDGLPRYEGSPPGYAPPPTAD